MVNNYASILGLSQTKVIAPAASVMRTLEHALTRIRQVACRLQRHHGMLQFERSHLHLHCVLCGYTSHGWRIEAARPQRRLAGDSSRHLLNNVPR